MKDDRPLVWIATPLRSFEGLLTPDSFNELAPHYRDPIQKISGYTNIPWRFEVCVVGGGGVARARNKMVAAFLESKAVGIFFVDYDLMPSEDDYLRILARREVICGGLYTIRAPNGHWVLNAFSGVGPREDGLWQVMELGTGFKYMSREAFDRVIAKNPWLAYESDDDHSKTEYGVFSMGPVSDAMWAGRSRWLTEDYWLDWLCRDADIPIVVDTTVQLRHIETNGHEAGRVFPDKFPPLPPIGIDKAKAFRKLTPIPQLNNSHDHDEQHSLLPQR